MSANSLQLKFGSALYEFRDVRQMLSFLTSHCYRDSSGVVWLHHGVNYHVYSMLDKDYYVNIPKGVNWHKRKRADFYARMTY